ncbi:Flagellar biosynthetic protein FlhB [Buchnera aphidicola (Thelaxes suberi)]|uniref:EscU/YscU/HrcU family type III secretion system export apparatus switch protein n=1 Tax=Buchnera aphidicola TaxID=9 RepID=UPI003464750A
MDSNSSAEKTEQPSNHRLKKAQNKGENYYSQELNIFLLTVFFVSVFYFYFSNIVSSFIILFQIFFMLNRNIMINYFIIKKSLLLFCIQIFPIFAIIFIGTLLISLIGPVIFGGGTFVLSPLKLNFSKINPLVNISRFFSIESIFDLFKMLIKFILIAVCITLFLFHQRMQLLSFDSNIHYLFFFRNFYIVFFSVIIAIITHIPVVILDFLFKRLMYFKKLKMTKQEVKDEYKEIEGNPSIKRRILQVMRMLSRRYMLQKISKSDVIITNPTHYAVALHYQENIMGAPQVLAKGKGLLALAIAKKGTENSIPIFESPDLAKILYYNSEVGKYIPESLYSVIAEILLWAWRLKEWNKTRNPKKKYPQKPHNLSIPSNLDI